MTTAITLKPSIGNPFYGGRAEVTDLVSRLGVVGVFRVCLFDRRTKKLIAETVSDRNGNYSFKYVANTPGGFFIVAFDDSGTPVNAAISDYITPEPMP